MVKLKIKPFHDPRPMQYIVIMGRIFGNKRVHGPFNTEEDAKKWAEASIKKGVHWEVTGMEKP